MATLPIDPTFARQAPYTPKSNIRVVFLPGPAQTAMAGELAKLPAETQEATLEELEVAGRAEEMIAAAEKLLSRPMYAAFLNWAEAAARFNTRYESDEEGNKLCVANTAAARTLTEVPSANIHDVLLKTRLLAIELAETPDFGSMIPEGDEGSYSNRQFTTLSHDYGTISPVMAAFEKLGTLVWQLSGPTARAIAPSIGRIVVDALQAARERNAAPTAEIDTDRSDFRNSLDGSYLASQRLNSLPNDYEDTHPAEYEIEANLACDACEVADQAVPKSWTEFLELLDHMSCKGRMFVTKENAGRLRSHADRLLSVAANGDGSYSQPDKLLLDTFAAMQCEMRLWFDNGPGTQKEDVAADARASALEDVFFAQRANTIKGVIAKLRETFRHLDSNAWSDHATLDPDHLEFQRGVKNTDFFTRALWHSIEDLARIGGVSLTEVRA
ncbi:hypothetical protein ACR720_04640 [Sphingomonas parapaucimobilis]|uniref:hypothetical protein n=1 Tax=Sphingomonas parapaucimobilis TaxID=28213 RepID=UPI0039E87008